MIRKIKENRCLIARSLYQVTLLLRVDNRIYLSGTWGSDGALVVLVSPMLGYGLCKVGGALSELDDLDQNVNWFYQVLKQVRTD